MTQEHFPDADCPEDGGRFISRAIEVQQLHPVGCDFAWVPLLDAIAAMVLLGPRLKTQTMVYAVFFPDLQSLFLTEKSGPQPLSNEILLKNSVSHLAERKPKLPEVSQFC